MIGFAACVVAIAALQWAVPFWGWVMVVPFVHAVIAGRRGAWRAIVPGVLAAVLVWSVAAGLAWSNGAGLAATRVATMLRIGSPGALLGVTAAVAGIAAIAAAIPGALLRRPRADRR